MDKTIPPAESSRGANVAGFGWFVRVWARPYRKRRGLGKCEANRFLMNRAVREGDSAGIAKAKIDKTFVIQNLFLRP